MKIKRILSIVLTLAMLLGMLPGMGLTAYANSTTTTITPGTDEAKTGTGTMTITLTIAPATVDVTGVSLNPSTAQTIDVGGKVSFTATVAPDNATSKKVKWNVSNNNVALYSNEACTTAVGTDATDTLTVYAKGVSAGSAIVTVTATNGTEDTADDQSASCNVTVNAAGPVASVTPSGGTATNNYTDFAAAVSAWTNGSTLTLLADVTTDSTISISGTKTLDLNGHGIRMTGSNAVFYLESNAIFNLKDSGNTVHYITLNDYLFASVSDSGTENIENGTGTVKVTGGYITGGSTTTQCNGSAVTCHKSGAVFNMYGGTIIGSNAGEKGAVLSGHENSGDNSNRGGTFNMHGGLIAYNKGLGLGVFEYGSATIAGGSVRHNSSGGIQMWAARYLSLSNAIITGNGSYGIDVDARRTAVHLSGKIVIENNFSGSSERNVYFHREDDSTNRLSVDNTLTEGSSIGVFLASSAPQSAGYIITKSSNTTYNKAACFNSDDENYAVIKKSDGQLYLVPMVKVTFDVNGHGTAPDSQTVASGSIVTEPAEPTADGYTFGGWYKESTCTNAWNFTTDTVTSAKTLYAKWTALSASAPTISTQPQDLNLTYGYTEGSVSVAATAATDTTYNALDYQWYSNTTDSNSGGTPINSTNEPTAATATYTIPTGKFAGSPEYYYCVVTATRTDNSQTETATSGVATVTVGKATPTIGTLSTTATYGDTMSSVKNWLDNQHPTGVNNAVLNGTWAWTSVQDADPVGNVGDHVYSVSFTPADNTNFNSLSDVNVTVTVGKADPIANAPDGLTATYG